MPEFCMGLLGFCCGAAWALYLWRRDTGLLTAEKDLMLALECSGQKDGFGFARALIEGKIAALRECVNVAEKIGSGASPGYALACLDLAVIHQNRIEELEAQLEALK